MTLSLSQSVTHSVTFVGSFPKPHNWQEVLNDPEASLFLLHSPSDLVLTSIALLHVCKNSDVEESWARSTKENFTMGTVRLECRFYHFYQTQYYLRVRHVRQEIGEWWAGSNTLEGRVNFVRVGSVFTSRKDLQNGFFWRFRSNASPILTSEFRFRSWRTTCCKHNYAGWSWPGVPRSTWLHLTLALASISS